MAKIEIIGKNVNAKNILEAHVKAGPAKVTIKFVGKRCYLIVEASADSEKEAFKKSVIVVKTNVGGQKVIEIPFLTH